MQIISDVRLETTNSTDFELAFQERLRVRNGIISLEENAVFSIHEATEFLSRGGKWVREDFIYTPWKKTVIFTKKSPIIKHLDKATQTHKDGKEFYLDEEDIEESLEDAIKISYSKKLIPSQRFGEDEITVFAFGDEKRAQEYGEFLRNVGINEMPLWFLDNRYVNDKNLPFARKLFFGGFVYRSGFIGDCRIGKSSYSES